MSIANKLIVGISDCKVTDDENAQIVTHSLGSCIGMALYDSKAKIGGMLHYMLPLSGARKNEKGFNPMMFGDTGIVKFFEMMYELGAKKENIRVVIAGGASINRDVDKDLFGIGEKNVVIAQKLLWKNNVVIDSEHVRDRISRTLYLDMSSGEIWIVSQGEKIVL